MFPPQFPSLEHKLLGPVLIVYSLRSGPLSFTPLCFTDVEARMVLGSLGPHLEVANHAGLAR